MDRIRRYIIVLVAVLAFIIPIYRTAEAAAWHSGNSYGLGADSFCTNGVIVTNLSPLGFEPGLSLAVNAYVTPFAHNSDEPISVEMIIPLTDYLGKVYVTQAKHETPYKPDDSPSWPSDWSKPIFWYGSEVLTWEPQAPGTVVAVQRAEINDWSIVGRVMDCTVGDGS